MQHTFVFPAQRTFPEEHNSVSPALQFKILVLQEQQPEEAGVPLLDELLELLELLDTIGQHNNSPAGDVSVWVVSVGHESGGGTIEPPVHGIRSQKPPLLQ